MPTVSVILPAYNAERYIADAVNSVLRQTFADFELIVIDDGSTDQTKPILDSIAAGDARVKVVSRPNTGYVVALNEAIDLSTGKYIARMDADDFSLPRRFAEQVAYLDAHPDVVLVGTHVAQMDGDGRVIGPMADVAFGHENIDGALMRRGWPIVHPAVMMRAAEVRTVGKYRPEFCPNEDHDLFLKLAEVGRVENLPEVLVYYRKHAASESTTKRDKSANLITRIIVDACRRRGLAVPAEAMPGSLGTPPSAADQCRDWGWHAVKHKNISTARHYAARTLLRRPLRPDSWRLAYCAARGR